MKIKSAFDRAWQDLKMPSDNIKSQSHRLFSAYQRGANDAHMIDNTHASELIECLELVIDEWQAGCSPDESEFVYRRAMAAAVKGRNDGG